MVLDNLCERVVWPLKGGRNPQVENWHIKENLQKNVTVLNIYTSNTRAPDLIKEILLDLKTTNGPQHSDSGWFQYLSVISKQVIQKFWR